MGLFTVPVLVRNWQNQFLPESERGEDITIDALVDTGAWRVLEPGMTSLGASVQRVTLREQPAETAEDRATSHRLH